uniref:Uncharacterized protein n=2 Tax=Myotis myotis TaxID=51298 RepID=A0A7J7Y0Y4_MYOMY|nr:hypothetical protein mMyoMyo1_011496 [Myotis myotis]
MHNPGSSGVSYCPAAVGAEAPPPFSVLRSPFSVPSGCSVGTSATKASEAPGQRPESLAGSACHMRVVGSIRAPPWAFPGSSTANLLSDLRKKSSGSSSAPHLGSRPNWNPSYKRTQVTPQDVPSWPFPDKLYADPQEQATVPLPVRRKPGAPVTVRTMQGIRNRPV